MTAPQTSAVAATRSPSPRRTTRTTDVTAPETSAVTATGIGIVSSEYGDGR